MLLNLNVMKTFKHWRKQELADTFGLRQKQQCDDLDDWLNSEEDISEDIERDLIRLQQILYENVYGWNKQELIYQFVAPFIHKIHYKNGTTVKTVGSNKNPDVMLKLALHFQNARQVSRFSA